MIYLNVEQMLSDKCMQMILSYMTIKTPQPTEQAGVSLFIIEMHYNSVSS